VLLARIRTDPGFEPGLTYQVAADLELFPSLVWGDPFVFLLYERLRRAEPKLSLYYFYTITSDLWLDVAHYAAALATRVRSEEPLTTDFLSPLGDELGAAFKRNAKARALLGDALQLTSDWLHDNASCHAQLTFYGA
jgi:hypothetical protein